MIARHRLVAVIVVGLVSATACGSGDESVEAPASDAVSVTSSAPDTARPDEPATTDEDTSDQDTSDQDTAAEATTDPVADEVVATTDSVATDSVATDVATTDSVGDEGENTGSVGRAVVDVDGVDYEFVVIQCLRDVVGPISDTVIEFQLDAVPSATPTPIIEDLLGVIAADADVLAEIAPVVEFGPILSITRVADGGELVSMSDLSTIEIISDGDPFDASSRSLQVSPAATGAIVTGTTTAGGSTVTVDATCP